MSKKPNTAAALAGILNAKRGEETSSEPAAAAEVPVTAEPPANPSPALPPDPFPGACGEGGNAGRKPVAARAGSSNVQPVQRLPP